ncbi:MAG: AtzE family amidohydrolase [Hyphomicrobiaceae bacterium]|nr:AtzE family amidohydrolase [Hyphomicrobiaceae bacterium]
MDVASQCNETGPDETAPASSALDIAAAVTQGQTTAEAAIEAALARIDARNGDLGAFTDVIATRALTRARKLDAAIAAGQPVGPLAGVPFAAKNLYDIAGVVTRAGSRINLSNAPAGRDATAIARLEAAGAILVGACTMDEYAYGFTGENAHEGPSRNPSDLGRMTGGSSGGPAAAVAGGIVPLALGSDTNGSIRVPASLTGIYGVKPTYGRLSRAGAFPFVASLDHVGPFARSLTDLAAAYDALQGADTRDPVCTTRAVEPVSALLAERDSQPAPRIALAGGYFRVGALPELLNDLDRAASALGVSHTVELPEAHRARAAAFVLTAAEGGALHLDRLRARAQDFDPDTRDRLIAGAMIPAQWVITAQRFRRWFANEVAAVFRTTDVILALATPITAPNLGQKTFEFQGRELPVRPHLGLYTQPLSFIGLPVVTVPLARPIGALPAGIQVIAAPWNEAAAFQVAAMLGRVSGHHRGEAA